MHHHSGGLKTSSSKKEEMMSLFQIQIPELVAWAKEGRKSE